LVFRAGAVVVDFTGKNPNVMYETGIAHTLGKIVVPVTQSLDDVPFDMKHHRVQKYLPNTQGLEELRTKLTTKLTQLDLVHSQRSTRFVWSGVKQRETISGNELNPLSPVWQV
jgi:hypothetical protein